MAEPEIKISVTVSTQAATAQLDELASRSKRAMAAYDAAAAGSRASSAALGKAFDAAMASGGSLTESLESAVARYTQYTASAEGAVGSTQKVVSSYYAAQGAARVLEGGIPIRAFEKFISTISGVGPLLQAAFPLIGLVAIGELAFEAGEKLAKAFDLGGERARQLRKDISDVDLSFRVLLDSTNVEIDKIKAANAKLEHKPNPNGMKLALDEALKDADKLAQKFDSIIQKEEAALKGMAASVPQQLLGIGGNTKYEQTMLSEHQRHLAEQTNVQGQLNESESYHNSLLARQKELLTWINDAGTSPALVPAYRTQAAAVQELLKWQAREQQQIKDEIELTQAQAAHTKLTGGGPKENYGDELAAQQIAYGESLGETVLYWQQVVDKTGKYHEQLLRAEEAFQKSFAEKSKFRAALKKDDQKETPKTFAESDNPEQKLSDYYDKTSEAYARFHEEITRGNEIRAQNATQIQLAKIAFDEQSGAISKVTADHERGAIQARLYSEKIDELSTRLKQLQGSIPQATAEGKLPEAETEIQRLKNEIEQLRGQGKVAGIQNQGTTAQDLAAPYIKATETINATWLQMQNKLIFGTRNISQAFANMGVSMLESFAQAWEKMLIKQLQTEVRMMFQHQITNQAQVAGDATAAAESDRISQMSSLKQVFHNAKVAATKAFKHYADVPPVPLVADVAAAATFALALSIGAFERGGIIPNTGLALVHEGEGVLPRNLTNLLSSVANNYQSSTATSIINAPSHYNGITDRNFREMARRHSDVMIEAAQKAARSGKVKIS